ncbi:GRB10-interacting GYF protein 2-like [Chironomus tepperi]|uniref:GRB10-interacting GYF protein 2-like n=1 Tax=Chironomus tepperi TaxID=113505 RepID=UPI00391F0705
MSESIKFGPEWLRNSLSTSPTKQEEIICRPILSDYRYSREDFLGLLDERNSKKSPEFIANGYRKFHIDHFQMPMVLIPNEDEKPVVQNNGHSRTFLNSNIKHGYPNNNWRKNVKEPELENWRSQEHKEKREPHYNPMSSRNGEKPKPNWRDKTNHTEEHAACLPYTPNKDYKQQEKEQNCTPRNDIKPQNKLKQAETVEEKQNQYVHNIVSDKTTKNLFENGSKAEEKKKKRNDSASIELNFKKLESDIIKGLQEVSLDEEELEKAINSRSQRNDPISWYYVDPLGKIQGPFLEEDMSSWYQHGFFAETLMLRRSIDNHFISLRQLIQSFGAAQPFMIASTGFQIPKVDHVVENMTYNKQPPKITVVNPQPQYDATMYRGQNLVHQYQEPNQYQNNIQQFQQNIPQNYQYVHNRPPQPSIPQMDPRLMNLNNGNQYIQTYNNASNNPNRIQQQMMPQMINQIPQQMKTPYQPPIINHYQQSMIQQMPSIIPTNPIQKILFELQKQKEMDQQRAMYIQHNHNQNVAVQTMNDQYMQQQQQQQQQHQQNKMENSRQKPIQTTFYSNNMPNKYDNNNYGAVNSHNQVVQQNNNYQHNQVNEHPQQSETYNGDEEGEFRLVGNLKRKKFQKEKYEKFKENGPQSSRSASKLPDGKITVIKNDLRTSNGDVKSVKSNNDVSQIIMNQINKVEEKSKCPAMPAPWIEKVAVSNIESENLNRIQIEEEEIRQIEMQIKREQEIVKAKKEQEVKQKVTQLSWNVVVTENVVENVEEPAVWEVPPKNSKIVKKSPNRQSLPAPVKPKILFGNSPKDVENDFKNWCMDMLSTVNTSIDIPVFVDFIMDLESPYEIEDYVKMYLGDTIESHMFIRKFLERRSLYRKATKKVEIDDDLCAPPKAINPGSHNEEPFRTQNKRKLDKKTRKGMKVDANILGFKATADPNRIVGELHEDEY